MALALTSGELPRKSLSEAVGLPSGLLGEPPVRSLPLGSIVVLCPFVFEFCRQWSSIPFWLNERKIVFN